MPAILLAKDRFGHPIQALKPGLVTNVTASTGGSQKMAAALNADTVVIRLISTVDGFVSIGEFSAVTASAGSMRVLANVPEYFRVDQGVSAAVAIIAAVTAGTLNITEMA